MHHGTVSVNMLRQSRGGGVGWGGGIVRVDILDTEA